MDRRRSLRENDWSGQPRKLHLLRKVSGKREELYLSTAELILGAARRLRGILFTGAISGSFFAIGKGTRIIPPLRLEGLRNISIGCSVIIQTGCWIQVVGHRTIGAAPVISIGNNASIGMDATISAAESIIIEDYALFARNVYISDHGHEYRDIAVPVCLQGIRKTGRVRIGHGAWLGQNVVVLPGVSIGRNAVIGANSVVNRDIPDFSVAVGAPAKVVRKYSNETGLWQNVGRA
jgi:acetyltransferase-like isoleucine patch superfamily enzyme